MTPRWTGAGNLVPPVLAAIRSQRLASAMIFGALLLDTAFTAAVPLSFKVLVDHAIVPKDYTLLVAILGGLTGGVIIVAATGLARDYLYARLCTRLLNELRVRLFTHLQRLSMDYFGRVRVADILARFSSDLAAIEGALMAALPWAVLPALDLLISTILLFALEWRLALVAMLAFPVCLVGPRLLTPRAAQASYRRKQDEAIALSDVQEAVAAQSVIKAFGLEPLWLTQFGQRIAQLARSSVRMYFLGSLVERSAGIGTIVLQVVVLGVGSYMAFSDQLSIGSSCPFRRCSSR